LKTSILNIGRKIYELEDSGSSQRILPMEGLRGLAVILVFFVHYHALFGAQLPADSFTFALSSFLECVGHSGVDLFFVLSGYLIYSILMKGPIDHGKFIKRRVVRIYPTFLFVLGLYLALSMIFVSENKVPADRTDAGIYILQNVLLLPGMFNIRPIITVAWSLSYEFFFYFLMPIMMSVLGIRLWARSRRVVFFIALSAIAIGVSLAGFPFRIQLILFISGVLVYEALKHVQGREFRRADWYGAIVLASTLALIYLISPQQGQMRFLPGMERNWWNYRESFLMPGFFAFVFFALVAKSFLKKALSWLPLRWLGNMSYSYYLIHGLTLKGIGLAVSFVLVPSHPLVVFWVVLPISFLLTLVTSTLLFMLVEKRFSLVTARPQPRERARVAVPELTS
jgi:exopolysaccharide production protein ExoZ